jgi:hypothetical protein
MRVSELIPVGLIPRSGLLAPSRSLILRSGVFAASRRIGGLWFNNAPLVVARLDRAIQYSYCAAAASRAVRRITPSG